MVEEVEEVDVNQEEEVEEVEVVEEVVTQQQDVGGGGVELHREGGERDGLNQDELHGEDELHREERERDELNQDEDVQDSQEGVALQQGDGEEDSSDEDGEVGSSDEESSLEEGEVDSSDEEEAIEDNVRLGSNTVGGRKRKAISMRRRRAIPEPQAKRSRGREGRRIADLGRSASWDERDDDEESEEEESGNNN